MAWRMCAYQKKKVIGGSTHARAESMQAVAAVATMGALALRAGEPAPDFSVVSHTGATVKLSDYAGKKVVLWFYPRASTGG